MSSDKQGGVGPNYLASPRLHGGPGEQAYIREQARFYNGLPDDWRVGLTLVPACPECCGDEFRDDRVNFALVCTRCGAKQAADVIRFGRLALSVSPALKGETR